MEETITPKKIQEFYVDQSSNILKLEATLNRFNMLRVLGIEHKELQHSNVLAWLLNPKESHDLGDFPLKRFIGKLDIPPEEKIPILLADLSDVDIRREFEHIDLLIVNENPNFVVCIENKFYAGLRDKQLEDYSQIVHEYWANKGESKNGYYKSFVYLTSIPRTIPESAIELGYYNVNYDAIYEIIEESLLQSSVDEDVEIFLKHYLFILKKDVMGNDKSIQLAQEIYKNHKEVLDFIFSNTKSIYSEKNCQMVAEIFEDDKSVLPLIHENGIMRMLPLEVADVFKNTEIHSWSGSDYLFAIEFFLYEDSLWGKFCFGANNAEDWERVQEIKTRLHSGMKKFDCFKKHGHRVVKSKATSKYPAICYFEMMTHVDDIFHNKSFKEAFKIKFEEFKNGLLKDWIKNVKDNFVTPKTKESESLEGTVS